MRLMPFKQSWFVCTIGALAFSATLRAQHVDHAVVVDSDLAIGDVVRMAFERHPDQSILGALERAADVAADVGTDPLAGPATIVVRAQHDLPGESLGVEEYEAGLQIPLKRFGESKAWRHIAAATRALHDSGTAVVRWRVGGLVRESLWALDAARADVDFATGVVRRAATLAEAVATRVALGDLAESDRLAARAEAVRAEQTLVESRARLADSVKRYEILTGLRRIPRSVAEADPEQLELTAAHPVIADAAAGVARAAAAIELAGVRARGNPAVTVGPRWEREASGAPFADTLGITLAVPFGGKSRREYAQSAAYTSHAAAVAKEAHVRRELELAIHEAEHDLAVARRTRQLALRRHELTREYLRKSEIAFEAGESDLAELIRAQAAADLAERDTVFAKIRAGRSVARLRQALGMEPLPGQHHGLERAGSRKRKENENEPRSMP